MSYWKLTHSELKWTEPYMKTTRLPWSPKKENAFPHNEIPHLVLSVHETLLQYSHGYVWGNWRLVRWLLRHCDVFSLWHWHDSWMEKCCLANRICSVIRKGKQGGSQKKKQNYRLSEHAAHIRRAKEIRPLSHRADASYWRTRLEAILKPCSR